MFTLTTVCTIQQLPYALTLGQSVKHFHPDATFVIGLADESQTLPAIKSLPYPVLSVVDILGADEVARLSAQYTPTEFIGAVKPAFMQAVYERFSETDILIYADPTCCFYQPLQAIQQVLATANILLTPHITAPPRDKFQPDEKHFQNVGLYSSGFLAVRRSTETERFLIWWDSRVRNRAYVNFCEGLCADQIWLMHLPAFFEGVHIIHDRTWHAALWNFHERRLQQETNQWVVADNGALVFVNFKGLTNPDEGFFPYQSRLKLRQRPDVSQLLNEYRQQVELQKQPQFEQQPHYGQQPEPVLLRGWQKATVDTLKKITEFIDTMPIPVIR